MFKATYSQSPQRWCSTGKRTILTAVILLVAVLLGAYVQDTGAPETVQAMADDAIELWPHAYAADSVGSELAFAIDNEPDPGAGISIDGNRYSDISPAGDRTKYRGVAIVSFSSCCVQLSSTPGITYTTVQAAVDAANEGDTVKVAGYCSSVNGRPRNDIAATGTVTQVVYISKTVTIRGGYTTAFTDPPDPEANPTTLDAGGQGRVLYITGDVSPTIEGLRITGGDAAGPGGGVYVITATATISSNRVFGNSAGSGGGICLFSSAATLDGNTIISNTAWQGGGLYLSASDAVLTNNIVADNQSGAAGSGLYIADSIPRLLHTTIARNGGGDGSGVYVTDAYGGYSTVVLTNTILVGHTVGITVTAGSTATLGATLLGSGAWVNEDDFGGEGYIYIAGGPYNNIRGPEYSIATLNAVSVKAAAEPFIVGDRWSISHGNLPLVPGSYASMPDLVVQRIIATSNAMTVVIRNQGNAPVPVDNEFWVDVYIDPAPVPTAVNQTWDQLCEEGLLWGVEEPALPLAPGEAVTLTVDDAYYWSAYSQVSWPLLAGTPVYAQADSADVGSNYGAVLESDEVAGGVHGDPDFVNPDAGDYHIGAVSAAIDAGVDAGVSTDIDGDGRPQGTSPDLGADEYGGDLHLYLPLTMRRWPPIPDTPVQNAISNPDGDGNYTVSWGAADLADSYTLQEDDNSSFSSATTAYSGSGTSWNEIGKATGTYYYRVRANNSWGSSGWSNVRSVTVQSSCVPDPPGESDNVDDALTVCSGQTVSGRVSDDDWDDVYKIVARANQRLTISMNGSGGDADLYLYPPGTTDVNTDPYVEWSENLGNDEFIQRIVKEGGFWYIDVFSYEGTTKYRVTATLSDAGASETKNFSIQTDQARDRHQGKAPGAPRYSR